jgi:hypothetical protein
MTMNEAIQHSDDSSDAEDDRRQARFVWFSETALVVGTVLVFFVFLTVLIRAYFPQGTSLMIDPDASVLPDLSWGDDIELDINSENGAVEQLFVGRILRIQRRVQHRGANTLTWNVAKVGDTVVLDDAVQTFARSTAIMEVNKNSRLTIGENSLIVFDQREGDSSLPDRNSALVMINGELSGKLSATGASPFRFGVNLPNSKVTLQPRTAGEDVEFLITVNDDHSTTVNVHEGTAQILGRDGTLETIGEQQYVTINSSGSEIRVYELARAPKTTGPASGMAVTYRNVPPQIQFTWNATADADRYHILIARDREFSDRVVDDDVIGTTFTHGALGPGSYYWYVRSRVGWSQSDGSAVRRLTVTQDLIPPTLELDPPPDTVQAGPWRLHGRTDADANVFVDEIPVVHQGGRIDHRIELRSGANVIIVTAVDAVGNMSYAPLLVNAK